MAQPRRYVVGPSFTPLPFGLLTSLATEIRDVSDPHWQVGVDYEVVCPLGDTTYDECLAVSGTGSASVAPPPPKTETATIDVRGATAFTVYAEVDCSAPGFAERAEQLAAEALSRSEQFQVERALWTGDAGGSQVVFPHLAEDTAVLDETGIVLQTAAITVVSGGAGVTAPLGVSEALGRLEAALAECYPGVGVIHAPRSLAPIFGESTLIHREGERYRTHNGNVVVFGAGYLGTSPSGGSSDAGDWIYATGWPFIFRGPILATTLRDSLNRGTNHVRALAERTYLVGWDCCHFATNVSLSGNTGT